MNKQKRIKRYITEVQQNYDSLQNKVTYEALFTLSLWLKNNVI